MNLRLVSETSSKANFEYDHGPAGTEGYLYYKDGVRVSRTFNPDDLTVTFGKPFKVVEVVAVDFHELASASYPAAPPTNPEWDRFLEYYKTKPPEPLTANKTAGTETDARAKIAGLQTGDVLRVSGVTFSRSSDGPCLKLNDLPDCTIEFVGCKAIHTGRTAYSVIEAERWHSNTKVYGLEVIGNANVKEGIRTQDSRGRWWGFKIRDCGGTGLMTIGLAGWDGPYDFRGEITNCGLNLDFDPHAEKGTGIHAAYIGGGENVYGNTGTFVLYVYKQPRGAALNLGSRIKDAVIVAWAEDLTFQAQSQVAGNVLQWWDNGPSLGPNITVPFVYGKDLQGRVVETDGAGAADWPIIHQYGRGERVCQNPRLTNVAYAPKPGFMYQDCEATYA